MYTCWVNVNQSTINRPYLCYSVASGRRLSVGMSSATYVLWLKPLNGVS